jgi:HD superfamily phosphodiesterase
MKRYFNKDFKRISHAMKVARHAEQIVKNERGDPAVVLSSAYLHDIGIKEAERKYNSTEARYQEEEGPPIALGILTRLGAREEMIREVCDIIGRHHHPKSEETLNFKCLYDADIITNLEEKQKLNPFDPEELDALIDRGCLTETGKKLARTVLLGASVAEL